MFANATDVAKDAAEIVLLERSLEVLHKGILEGRKSFGNVMKYLLMGTSSNFGNMFSMAGAAIFLPFLPMLPVQILLNNFLYDLAQVTIPTDNVDATYIRKPQHCDIKLIRNFMFIIGPISSIYDFLTFYILLKFFQAGEQEFHTGWFVESLATQTAVVFIIRTAGNPFKSRPSLALSLTVLAVIVIAVALPFSPLAGYLGFVPLPFTYFLFLGAATITYLLLVELVSSDVMYNGLPWPTEEFSKVTMERDLHIRRTFRNSPILWSILGLLATYPPSLCYCSVFLRAICASVLHHWRAKSTETISGNNIELMFFTTKLLELLALGQLLPPPLSYLYVVVEHLEPNEIAYVLKECVWNYMVANVPAPALFATDSSNRLFIAETNKVPDEFQDPLRNTMQKRLASMGNLWNTRSNDT